MSISSSPRLNSILDYATSIQQIWTELKPSTDKQLSAKCFRCCLEYCRLLEMIDRLTDSAAFDKDNEQTLSRMQKCSVEFLKRYGAKALRNKAAPRSQRLRITITAVFPNMAIKFVQLRRRSR